MINFKKMNKLFYILIVAVFITCWNEKGNAQEVTISGTVTDYNPDRADVVLLINYLGVEMYHRAFLTLDNEGKFSYTYNSYMPSDITVKSNNGNVFFRILAHPGDRINMSFKNGKRNFWKSLKFEGDRSIENKQIAIFQQSFKQVNHAKIQKAFREMNLDDFKLFMDGVQNSSLKIYNDFIDKENPKEEVADWARWIAYEPYFYNKFWYMRKNISETDVNPFDFLDDLLPITEPSLSATYVLNLFASFYGSYLREGNKKELDDFSKQYNDTTLTSKEKKELLNKITQIEISNIIKNSKGNYIKEIVLAKKFTGLITKKEIGLYEKNLDLIEKEITITGIKKQLHKYYTDTKHKIDNPATKEQILTEVKGQSIYGVLDTLFRENKDKVIAFDFWGLYCGHCFTAFPHLNQIIEEKRDKPLEFVFFCLDGQRDKGRYKMLLEKYNLKGTLFCLDKKQTLEFSKLFNIVGIPHKTLFDKEGIMRGNGSDIRDIEETIEEWIE
jgi:thiol-disulfide isomerase/thioredoxin